MQRLALFGGSFDPVHLGHLLVAQAAMEELAISWTFFIPAAQSPFKPDRKMAAAPERIRLLHLALQGWCRAKVDLQEINRGGTSYSIETVQSYRARFPGAELFYLIGADHVRQLPKWREAERLAELVEFVVIPRPGEPLEAPAPGFRVRSLRGFPLAVSSSQVRQRVQAGLPIDLLTGSSVAEAIYKRGLYR